MSIMPLAASDARVKARFSNMFLHLKNTAAKQQIDLDGFVYRNGCQSRLFNPLEVQLDTLDDYFTSEWSGLAFDFYLHNNDYMPCCSSMASIARSVYAITLKSEDTSASSCTVRSVQLYQSDGNLYAATRRHTAEFTYVPGRRTTRLDTKVTNTLTLTSLSDLDNTLEEFVSLISLGIALIPREEA